MVSRKLLHERGVVLAGRPPAEVFAPVSREELDEEMRWNLQVYWRGRLAHPWRFLFDEGVQFAVSTLARIAHTRATGEVISKQKAIAALPEQWRVLADAGSMGRIRRARETLRMIGEMTSG